MQILFYDATASFNYTDITRIQKGLGGTESTITRIAHALAEKHDVVVAQRCRKNIEDTESNGVRYLSFSSANQLSPDVVILLRKHKWLEPVAKLFPHAKRFFWMHDAPSRKLYTARRHFHRYNYDIIAVSDSHQKRIKQGLSGRWYQRLFKPWCFCNSIPPIHRMYNPIDDRLEKNDTVWRPQQMILASSPDRGLNLNLETFEKINQIFPEYELLIATYAKWNDHELPSNVRFLGSLPQHELFKKIRESFCVLYTQYHAMESFGLIYAESNAVGTPVLAHDFGAAREVLSDSTQLVDGRNINSIIEKIKEWRKNRPVVQAKPEFRLSHVKQEWIKLLEK